MSIPIAHSTPPPPTGSIQMGQSPPHALIPTVDILSDAALSSAGINQCALLSQLGDVSQTSVQSSVQSDLSNLVYITDGLPPIPKKLYQKIKDWQFVDLHDLSFKSAKGREEENNFLQQCDGKVLLVQSMDHLKR